MHRCTKLGLLACAISLGPASHAEYAFWSDYGTLSAFQDTSNLLISSSNYKIGFNHNGADTVYIDDLQFTGDTGDLALASGLLKYEKINQGDTLYTYQLGDAVTDEVSWKFDSVAAHAGASLASLGIHSFTLNIWGRIDEGDGPGVSTILGSFNFGYDVADKLDISVTGSVNKEIIKPGETSSLSMTVRNNMDRAFISNTWFGAAIGNGSGAYLDGEFDWSYQWFDRTILSGESLTGGHSFWTAKTTAPDGIYSGSPGVVGGLYEGDWHFVGMNPPVQITVQSVPGPAPFLSMAIGLASVLAKKRRKGAA